VLKLILTTKIAQISIHVKNRGLISGAHGNNFSVHNLWGIVRAKMNNQPAKIHFNESAEFDIAFICRHCFHLPVFKLTTK
jgi:hypothetical protein